MQASSGRMDSAKGCRSKTSPGSSEASARAKAGRHAMSSNAFQGARSAWRRCSRSASRLANAIGLVPSDSNS